MKHIFFLPLLLFFLANNISSTNPTFKNVLKDSKVSYKSQELSYLNEIFKNSLMLGLPKWFVETELDKEVNLRFIESYKRKENNGEVRNGLYYKNKKINIDIIFSFDESENKLEMVIYNFDYMYLS